LIVQDSPSNGIYEYLRDQVLTVRPADLPDADRYCKTFVVTKADAKGDLIGGAYVYVHPGWAYFDLVWVREDLRGKGLGRKLMEKIEDESQKRGCHSVYLWTQDFEAPGFYEKLGYRQFVVMDNFNQGHQRIGFMKRLAA
jgi:GNAT superfamily N-acetyltransferase